MKPVDLLMNRGHTPEIEWILPLSSFLSFTPSWGGQERAGVSHKQDDGTTTIFPLPSTSSAGHPDTHGKTTRRDAAIRPRCLSLLQELFMLAF